LVILRLSLDHFELHRLLHFLTTDGASPPVNRTACCFGQEYHLVDNYMRSPADEIEWTNIDEKYLSSDVVSIALTYFLSPPRPSLKYAI
jgi:hypothetical protein